MMLGAAELAAQTKLAAAGPAYGVESISRFFAL